MISNAVFYGGDGPIGEVVSNTQQIETLLGTLTEQSTSGKVAMTYGGMTRFAASTSLSLRPQLSEQQATSTAIDAVQGRMDVQQNALTEISSIASNFEAQTVNLSDLNASEVDSIAASARDALQQVAGLLDATDGTIYVFAGSDSTTPPVPDPGDINSSNFANAISTAVAGLTTNGAAATIANTLQIAGTGSGSVSPFSASITNSTTALPTVSLGSGQFVPAGILAGSNAAITSLGTSTTGSYMRDILRSLATIASMSSSQATSSDFSSLVEDTRTSLSGALTALNQDAGVLGNRQAELTQTQSVLSATTTSLTTQVGNVEDVDMTSTLSQLTQVQTQLQASYQVIAALQAMSLSKFLA